MKKRKVTDIDERVIREDTRIALQKASLMKEEGDAPKGQGAQARAKMWSGGEKIASGIGNLFKGNFRRAAGDAGSGIADVAKGFNQAEFHAADLIKKAAKYYTTPDPEKDARIKANADASSKLPANAPLSQDQAKRIDTAIEKNTGKTLPAKDYSSLPKTQADVPKTPEAPKAETPETPKTPEAPKTPAPGTSPTAQTFKQAFASARKEAGGGKGQFEYGGKKFQTNIAPAKGAEKYIAASKQKTTSVNVPSTPKADTKAPETMMTTGKGPSLDAAAKVGITQADTQKGQGLSAVSQVGKQPAAPKAPETPAAPEPPKSPATTPSITGGGAPETPAPAPNTGPKSTEPAQVGDQPGKKYKNTDTETKSVNESVVTVGSNRYRIL
jgi:hypothetical protein